MPLVTVTNSTSARIYVRLTHDREPSGTDSLFHEIDTGKSNTWTRNDWQVAFILRDDTDNTETFVAKPGNTYQIASISGAAVVATE